MYKWIHWKQYLPFAIAAAVVYNITVIIYVIKADYTDLWLLYLGNFLFMAAMAAFLFNFNAKRDQNAGSTAMMAAGHIAALMGIVIGLVLAFIIMFIFIPHMIGPAPAENVLENNPANQIHGRTNGLVFTVVANALVGNGAVAAFICTILPFTLKGDQTKDSIPTKQRTL